MFVKQEQSPADRLLLRISKPWKVHVMVLIGFFALTFLTAWVIWIPQVFTGRPAQSLTLLAGFAPSAAGLLFIYLDEGRQGLHRVAIHLAGIWGHWKWYLLVVFGPAALLLTSLSLHIVLGGQLPRYSGSAHLLVMPDQWFLVPAAFLYALIFSALAQEIGWRGFALPRLMKEFGNIRATLLLGAASTVWQLPLFFIAGNFYPNLPAVWFILQAVITSFLYTWIYNRTNGSLLPVVLFNAAIYTALGLLPVLPADFGRSMLPLWIALILEWVVVGLIYIENPRWN